MALNASTSNLKLKQPRNFVSKSHTGIFVPKPPSLIKSKQPNSKCTSLKSLTLKNRTPICKFVDSSSNAGHDSEKRNDNKRIKSSANPIPETGSDSYTYWWSNVEVKRPKNVFVPRKWSFEDVELISLFSVIHILALFAPFTFTWGAFWVTFVLAVATGMLGLCLSYHRQLSHKSFKLPKWLEYSFAYCGVLALQKDPIYWVSIHRYHHQFSDTEKDPHSPYEGFWFSHINWLFDAEGRIERCGKPNNNVKDLEDQPFYRFMRSTFYLHSLFLGGLLYLYGGFPYIVWGMGLRTVLTYHMTFSVGSIGHVWGNRPWNTGDLSTNNWWLAFLTFGDGWHNNHHAFQYSAKQGLEWWQVDMTWYTIKLLELLGLATEVKLPAEEDIRRLTNKNDGITTATGW